MKITVTLEYDGIASSVAAEWPAILLCHEVKEAITCVANAALIAYGYHHDNVYDSEDDDE